MVHRSRTTVLAALAAALMLPSIGSAQDIAPVVAPAAPTLVMAPATVSVPAATPSTMTIDSAAGPLTTARAVGLQHYFEIWDPDVLEAQEQKAIEGGLPEALANFSFQGDRG